MWDSYRGVNICIIGLPEGEDREKGTDEIFETIVTENFPISMVDTNPWVQEAQRVASRINAPKKLYLGISFSNYRKSEIKNT